MAALKRRPIFLAGEILAWVGQTNELETADSSCQTMSDFDGLDRARGARISPLSQVRSSTSLQTNTMANRYSRDESGGGLDSGMIESRGSAKFTFLYG